MPAIQTDQKKFGYEPVRFALVSLSHMFAQRHHGRDKPEVDDLYNAAVQLVYEATMNPYGPVTQSLRVLIADDERSTAEVVPNA